MSEFPETRDLLPKAVSPNAMVGIASPLWGLFAGAAATGVAWWWMTRWARPQNLEALFGALTPAVDTVPEAMAQEALSGVFPRTVVGGEGAPLGIVMEALVEAEAEVETETEADAAAEPVEVLADAAPEPEAAPEPVLEAAPAPEPTSQPKPEPKLEAVIETAPALKADPKPEPVAEAAPAPKARPKAAAEPRSVAPKSGPAATPKAD